MPPSSTPRRRRIGILCHGAGSGSTRAALDLAGALHRHGERVVLLTLGRCRWEVPAGIRSINIGDAAFPQNLEDDWSDGQVSQLAADLGVACSRGGIHILHYHYGLPFAEAAQRMRSANRQSQIPIVATLHGGDVLKAAPGGRLAAALASADVVCSVSRAYAERVSRLLGGPCERVPNFLPDERRMALRGRSPSRVPVLVHVSNFRAVKNVHDVAKTFIALRRTGPFRLKLIGDGPHRHSLQVLLRAHAGAVEFLGQLDNPVPALLAADVMLLASRAESFSIAALEAMAAGIPVVAPDIEGLSETVRDGEGGLLFTVGRPQDAAGKVLRLRHAPQLYRRLARGAQRASLRYGEAETLMAYLAIYDRLFPT